MFCSNCGKELEAGDLFCGYCGARQELAQATQENPAVEEPAAGNEASVVGYAAQATQEGPAAPVAAAGKSLVGWVLAGVVMVIVLIAALSNGTPPSRREPPISVRVSNTSQKDTTKEVKSDNASNLKEVPTTSAPKSTVATTTVQKDTTKEVKSDNTSNLKEVPTTSAPKSTVVTTTAASSTSVTAPAGLRVVTSDDVGWVVHSVKRYYDSAGNLIRVEYYGADGQLTLNNYGYAISESEYDSAGNLIRKAYYGVAGRLTLNSNGVAITEWEYDNAGKETRQRWYDTQGRLVN